jgi:hypothetical protein
MILIVLKKKPFEEILKMIQGHKKILVVGCNGCAGIYQVGGEKQAEVMGMLLEMATKLKGVNIDAKAITTLRQCDRQIVATTINPLVDDYDGIISMACGVGIQTLADVFENKVIIPANDTKFIGMQDSESGKFYEFCSACGECILFETAGICPITRCAKGLLNGPCGGCFDGKCEVPIDVRDDNGKVIQTLDQDCAWYMIYDRLKRASKINLFRKYRPPKKRAISGSPRQL